jgi:hypothetical protein
VPKAFRGRVLSFSEQAAAKAAWDKASAKSECKEAGEQAAILRDIFGNPFRSTTIDSSWITTKVAQLAKAIYDTENRNTSVTCVSIPLQNAWFHDLKSGLAAYRPT